MGPTYSRFGNFMVLWAKVRDKVTLQYVFIKIYETEYNFLVINIKVTSS